MKIVVFLLSAALLSACATRTIEKQTIVEKPPRVEYVPGPQGPPGPPGRQGDTAVVIPNY
jgi:hypothetical protein